MRAGISSMIFLILVQTITAQNTSIELNNNWQFSKQNENKWYKATVPGTIYTDLLANKLILDPFFGDNETRLQWIDRANWEYRTTFDADQTIFSKEYIELVFDGLDTYATVYLNGKMVLDADNMFRGWTVNIKPLLHRQHNELRILFSSALNKVDSIARSRLPLTLPDNNRVYARKAQFQFGWDWGPKFVGCGIWKKVSIHATNFLRSSSLNYDPGSVPKLIQQKDSMGTSFYFEKDGKPIYIKGANWIPADIFLPRVQKQDYRKLLQMAKDANINMLRVWGGGIYEDDAFYDACDELGIMVWQDLMFAGGMYPADKAFMNNVHEEIKYQVTRLMSHPCIVLWCGNNEIDEAWHNWGWQEQFNLHGTDSAKVWSDYQRLFEDSIPKWLNEYDGTRPYIPSSPKYGWGNEKSLTEGDSHYWGLWWGLEDWEVFKTKTGRFVSEYGMQSMPNTSTINSYTNTADRQLSSPAIQSHQKASDGFKKLNYYLGRYFIDSSKISSLNLEQYTYLTQCLQYYILKNSIITHRNKAPYNMGTMLWQLNDCWPVTSWSIIDHSKQPKAAYFAVKEAYRDDIKLSADTTYPLNLQLQQPIFSITPAATPYRYIIKTNSYAKYVFIELPGENVQFNDNYFDLAPGQEKIFYIVNEKYKQVDTEKLKIISLYNIQQAIK